LGCGGVGKDNKIVLELNLHGGSHFLVVCFSVVEWRERYGLGFKEAEKTKEKKVKTCKH